MPLALPIQKVILTAYSQPIPNNLPSFVPVLNPISILSHHGSTDVAARRLLLPHAQFDAEFEDAQAHEVSYWAGTSRYSTVALIFIWMLNFLFV